MATEARWYRLDRTQPVPCRDLAEWAEWMRKANRHVGDDRIDPLHVSTVFLGLDHRYGEGEPLLFETMIFDGADNAYQVRTSTWSQAEKAHAAAITVARSLVAAADAALSGQSGL